MFLIGAVYSGCLRQKIWLPMALLGLITIAATQSRTALAVLLIAGFAITKAYRAADRDSRSYVGGQHPSLG